MTQLSRLFRFRVHTAGTVTPVDGTVDFVLDSDEIAEGSLIEFGGQTVVPLEGRTESPGAQYTFVDRAGFITSKLADAGGRMHLMRRLWETQISTDSGSTWTTVQVDRIVSIHNPPNTALYTFSVKDERHIERTTTIFAKPPSDLAAASMSLTRLIPQGIDGDYGPFDVTGRVHRDVSSNDGETNGNMVTVTLDNALLGPRMVPHRAIRADIFEQIRADVKDNPTFSTSATAGNFETVRCRVNGTLREVFSFGTLPKTRDDITRRFTNVMAGLESTLFALVVWSDYAGETITEAVVIAPTHEPTRQAPLHWGGKDGLLIGDAIEQVYDGDHSESGEAVRYDAAATTALKEDRRLPRVRFRITESANMAAWLEENIYKPFGIIPFIDSQGRVAPKLLRLPRNVDPATFFEFNAQNSTQHASWDHAGQDQITRLRMLYTIESLAPDDAGVEVWNSDYDGDFLLADEKDLVRDHDRRSVFGTLESEVKIVGLHRPTSTKVVGGLTLSIVGDVDAAADEMAILAFQLYGDGPTRGRIGGLSSTDSVKPGDFVRLDFASYPNPALQARGGERVVAILEKKHRYDFGAEQWGIEYTYLDAGPNSQALTAPAVSAVQNATRPKQAIDVTISSLPAGATYILQAAKNATEPSSTSGLWQTIRKGVANETVTIEPLASGFTYWYRAYAAAQGRISSAYSTADDAATAGLTAPTSPTQTSVNGAEHDIGWTLGETDFDLEVRLDEAVCASATRETVASAPAGTKKYRFSGLTGFAPAEQVWQVDVSVPTFFEETADFNDADANDVAPFPGAEAVGDYLAIGYSKQFGRVTLIVGTAGIGGAIAWEYWNGSAWTALSGVVDGTSGYTIAGESSVAYTVPSDWATTSLNGVTKFYIRARVTTVYSTNPVLSQGGIHPVYCAGVRHIDRLGGVSSEATIAFSTGAGKPKLTAPLAIFVSVG